MACCSFDQTVDRQFSAKKATRDLHRYRRRGPGPTTRMLRDELSKAGLAEGTLLDVGGGLGALTFELLERGMQGAVIVEASAAFAEAASTEATRRLSATVQVMRGDFLDVADHVRPAAVVSLDRVICCYPLRRAARAGGPARRTRVCVLVPQRPLVRPSRRPSGQSPAAADEPLPDVRASGGRDVLAGRGRRI